MADTHAVPYTEPVIVANPTDDDCDRAVSLKGEAAELAATDAAAAVAKMTEALRFKGESAMYWAFRAKLYLDAGNGEAAIKDATTALGFNPENARALRVRGLAAHSFERWEQAADDLNAANRVDYDDATAAPAKEATEKANALRIQRRREEQEAREAEAEKARAAAEAEKEAAQGGVPPGMPPGMEELLQDPEIAEALKDPEVAMKMQSVMQNPMAAMALMQDPKVGPVIQKMMAKMMAGGGMPGMGGMGGMPGGMGGMGGMPGMGGMGGMPGGMGGMPGMGGMGGMPGGMGGMGGMPGGMGGMGGMPGMGGMGGMPSGAAPQASKPNDDLD